MSSNNNKQFKYCAKNLGLKQTYITWYRISITNLHQGCVNDPRSCKILVRFYLTLNRALWRAVIHCKTSFKYLVMFLTVCQCIYVFFELNINVYKPLKVQQKEFRNKSMSLFIATTNHQVLPISIKSYNYRRHQNRQKGICFPLVFLELKYPTSGCSCLDSFLYQRGNFDPALQIMCFYGNS